MKQIRLINILIASLVLSSVSAQLEITSSGSPPFTPENLIENVFLGSGVEVLSVTIDGSSKAAGFFSGATNEVGLERGIVISTSQVSSIDGPNSSSADEGAFDITNGSNSDVDLDQIATGDLKDVFSYTITFRPTSDTLRFRYVFASEEYPEFVCNAFNDIFGFFITGPDPVGGMYTSQNIALVPDPSDPSGLTFTNIPVAIDNIHDGTSGNCPPSFPEFYKINPLGTQNFRYDAYTSVFIAEAIVIPCEEYTIKLAIADVGDNQFGSCVFLEAKSFGTGTLDVSLNSLSADGSLAEGCSTGFLEFVLPEAVDRDYIIDIDFLSLPNSATPGVDFSPIPEKLVIPAGSSSISIPLEAISDGITENDEVIAFEIQVDLCNRKEFQIMITDNDLVKPLLPADVTICDSESFRIESELDPSFVLPTNPYFENVVPKAISPEYEAIYSDINVTGVVPTILTPDVIESVCIIGLEHRLLTDFDIFLISPGGQFLELSTDNGFKSNNTSDIDRLENTCFSPTATTNINNGENLGGDFFDGNPTYSGNFLPEGVWADLWDTQNPTNGRWRLLIIDDETGFEGTLEGWSMSFRSAYNLTYEWSSVPSSILCENCENIEVSPDVDTEYTLKITDSYGCEESESIDITVTPSITEPSARCGLITESSIQVIWDAVIGSQGYEVRVDGGAWINVPSSEDHTFQALLSDTDYDIEVRTIGLACNSKISSIVCRTDDCRRPEVVSSILQEVTCPGGSDGEITLVATGIPPFVFDLAGVQNMTGVFTDLTAGLKSFIVTDVTGCSELVEVLMPGPADFALIPSYKLDDPCNLVSAIRGSFNISGGTPPYSYRWSNLTTSPEASNLSPGTYFLSITDSRNCEAVGELVVPDLDPLRFDIIRAAPLCLGEDNGTATVQEVSGTGPYTYLWEDGSTEQTNANLSAGFHLVTVTDALGCETPSSVTIDAGPSIDVFIGIMPVSCSGASDGSIGLTPSGGKEPYSFSVGAGTPTGSNIIDLVAGQYTLTVTDANNCILTQVFDMPEPQGIAYVVGSTNNFCFGDAKGTIQVTQVSSPNGMVAIAWQDGSSGFSRGELPAGEYCFTLSDGTSCEIDSCLIIASPTEIIVSENVTPPTCENSENGSIDLIVNGGLPPYKYVWVGPTMDIPDTSGVEDLMSGDYSVTISDANDCVLTKAFTLEPANPLIANPMVFPVDCRGDKTGQIFFSVSGGQPPVAYSWTGPGGFTASTNNISEVGAGMYQVIYVDQNGCQGKGDFLIAEPSLALNANISSPDTICDNSTSGQLTVSPQGGTFPYDIMWSNEVLSAENFGLNKGNYQVTITDSRSCTVTASSTIYENETVNIQISQLPSSCFQTRDGSAIITDISYGTTSANIEEFEKVWNTSPIQSTKEARNLIGGNTYTVLVTDRYGCVAQQSIEVGSPDIVSAEIISVSNVSCFNGKDGSIEVGGTGGNGGYTYEWDVNAGNSTSAGIRDLKRGEYAVSITDEKGCSGFNRFSVEEPRPLSMDFRVIDVSCFEGSNGRAEVLVRGGTAPYTYLWTNNSTEKAIADVVSQQYNVTVTDANGCSIIDSTKVEEPDDGLKIDWVVDDLTCFGANDGRIQISASGGSGFYRYSIDGVTFTSGQNFLNLPAGSYTLYASDFKGCSQTFPGVNVSEPIPLTVDLGEDKVISFAEATTLNPIITGEGNFTYQWESANLELLTCTSCPNPTFDGQREASYELIVTDENGCRASDFITIRLQNFSPLFVPTAFTPNGDSENDVLIPFGARIAEVNTYTIYNRWGDVVFRGKDLKIGDELLNWDGVYKGEEAPSGLYYWAAEVTYNTGFQDTFRGETTLLR